MKTSTLLAASCCFLMLSCSLWETRLSGIKSKDDCHHRNPYDDNSQEEEGPVKLKADTTLYFSAVEFPKSYDWIKDSLYGLTPFELILYKDSDRVLSISSTSGLVSPNPDTHHIIDGNLYTEFCQAGQTIVCRNGKEVLRLDRYGTLKGIVETPDHIYTLFQEKYGNGIMLMEDERVLFEEGNALVFGDLCDPSYFPTGALYLDMGKLRFCFASTEDGLCYNVTEGVKSGGTELTGVRTVLDMKIIDGKECYSYDRYRTNILTGSRLWRHRASYSISGLLESPKALSPTPVIMRNDQMDLYEILGKDAGLIYVSSRSGAVLHDEEGQDPVVHFSNVNESRSFKGCMIMSPKCLLLDDKRLNIALSSRDPKLSPYIIIEGRDTVRCDIHGYISGISRVISLPI